MAKSSGGASQPLSILVLMADQLSAIGPSYTGNPLVRTPHLDRLAARSMRYERAYTAQPLCHPSRATMQTGIYPHESGVLGHGMPVQRMGHCLGHRFQQGGYDTPYSGRYTVQPLGDAMGYDTLTEGHDDAKTAAAIDWLRAPHDRPWYLTVSYLNPHNICEFARRDPLPDGPIPPLPTDPAELPELPINHAIPADEPPALREAWSWDRSSFPTADFTDLDWRQYLWAYWRLVEKVDAEIGQVLDVLDEQDLWSRTAVVFLSDHGDGLAMQHWNQKRALYDQIVRVPFMVAVPGQAPGVSHELVSAGLDLPSTLVDLAGLSAPPEWRGVSLMRDHAPREAVFTETTFGKPGTEKFLAGRMVRTARHKYIIYSQGEPREQLFDLEADPHELRNLLTEPAAAGVLQHHRRLLAEWAAETDDDFPRAG